MEQLPGEDYAVLCFYKDRTHCLEMFRLVPLICGFYGVFVFYLQILRPYTVSVNQRNKPFELQLRSHGQPHVGHTC